MGQVIDIFSRQGLEKDFSGASDIYLESSAVSGKIVYFFGWAVSIGSI